MPDLLPVDCIDNRSGILPDRIFGALIKSFSLISALLFTIYCLLFTAAWAFDIDAVASKVQKTYDGIQDIQADFVQLTTSASIKETEKAEGVVYFKKPGMMRWEYKSPNKDMIVSDGKKAWVYQQDIGQVMVSDVPKSGTSISNNFLSGMGNLKKDFEIAQGDEKEDEYVLKLKPREPQPNLRSISIAIDRKTFLVRRTIVHDMLGNRTEVIFEGIKTNQSPETVFQFKAPKGVRVVE